MIEQKLFLFLYTLREKYDNNYTVTSFILELMYISGENLNRYCIQIYTTPISVMYFLNKFRFNNCLKNKSLLN